MRRREFISLLGSAAAWPLGAYAQQQSLPLVGFLNAQSAAPFDYLVGAFKQGLSENGFIEGKSVAIEYRWANRQFDQLPALAADLVGLKPAVIAATGGAHNAAMAATKVIPLVCSFGSDPVRLGFVASLNRPGGNVTGMMVLSSDLEAKRLELLNEIVPRGASLGYLIDPNFDASAVQRQAVEAVGREIGRQIKIVEVGNDAGLEAAFSELEEARVAGLAIASNPLFNNIRDHVLALSAKLRIPAVYEIREFTVGGGLMSYGSRR